MNFTLQFTMLSDWHVGAGFGRPGSVDRLLVRDADDLPYLPAKTIRGMWRDAAERLARALDEGAAAREWQALVDDIFGTQPALGKQDPSGYHNDPTNRPRETVLRVTAAQLPDALRAKLRGKGADRMALRAAVSFVKPGVMIEPVSGRAKDDHLRFEEMGRTGTVLVARCAFDPTRFDKGGPRFEAARALMLAATKLITRIGGKRRRGAGKCEVTAPDADGAGAISYLKANAACPAPSDKLAGAEDEFPAQTASGGEWVSVPLKITLRGPVAVPARTVGNVVETLDFVPGTFLLPHVTRVLKGLGIDARAAIARGDIRVLNATIDVNGEAGRPVPLALSRPKGKTFEDRAEVANGLLGDEPQKPFRDGYVGPSDPAPGAPPGRLRTPPIMVGTHNVVEDGPQRPTEKVGGVYSFEAIAATDATDGGRPVVLRTELRLRASLVPASADWTKLNGTVYLGISKKDDYGEAVVEAGKLADVRTVSGAPKDNALFVWLLSDVLLRGEGGQSEPTVEVLQRELGKRLGGTLTVAKTKSDFPLPLSFVRVRRTESWHTGWGLPRPSLVGLQAGSCVKFVASAKPDLGLLAGIERAGLGERTAEGFGQVAFNHPLLTKAPAEWTAEDFGAAGAQEGEDERTPSAGAGGETASHIEEAAWRESVRVAVLAATATAEQRKGLFDWEPQKPNMSQLGGLRAAIQLLKTEADGDRVRGWLDAVGANGKREKKWPSGSLDKLRALLTTPGGVWAALRDKVACPGLEYVSWPVIAGTQVALERELWAFAVRALIDAAIRAHKRAGEEREG